MRDLASFLDLSRGVDRESAQRHGLRQQRVACASVKAYLFGIGKTVGRCCQNAWGVVARRRMLTRPTPVSAPSRDCTLTAGAGVAFLTLRDGRTARLTIGTVTAGRLGGIRPIRTSVNRRTHDALPESQERGLPRRRVQRGTAVGRSRDAVGVRPGR